MNKLFIFIFVIFSFIISTLYSETDNADPDRFITDIYVKNSYKQFKLGNFEEALSLSNIALSFSKDNSDALYIRSVSNRNLGKISAWKEDLASAIIFNTWNYYNEIFARAGLSQFMFLDGNLDEAYLNLRPFRNELANNTIFTELFIRISLSVGNVEDAISIAENRLGVDPYDNYSQLIMAMYDPEWIDKAERILVEGDPSNYFSKEVVQFIINNRSDCKFLNDLYLNRWGADRFYNISNACEKTVNLSEILSELYPDNIRVNFSELTRIYNLFKNENNRKKIINWLSSISLTVLYDTDGDGFIDTEAFYNKSNLKYFNYDSNHDNNFDYYVELDKVPVNLEIITKTGKEKYSYKDYPYLINVVKSSDQALVEYQLIPYNLSFEIISIPIDFTREIPYILDNISFPDNDILTLSSTLKTIINLEENTISNYSIIGLDESVEKVINADGVKILERHYKNTILITVYKDFDGDGVFDTIYDYIDGILKTVSFDENNNGISEYIENYEPGLVSSWDFNEDGLIDSREKYENGIIYRELSSNLDGIFDTTLEITSDME
ncbi:MAG: hypothetical protein KAH95_15815 [Spirochaetales bacterium]|nr:hypothetical protein [Spirochaetales bacterium]